MLLIKYIFLTVHSRTELNQILKIYLGNKIWHDIIYHQALSFTHFQQI
jgi:hypothetical protein